MVDGHGGGQSPLILTFSPEGAKGPAVTAVIEVLFFDIADLKMGVGSWQLGVAEVQDQRPPPATLPNVRLFARNRKK